jgi:hypothetical protein
MNTFNAVEKLVWSTEWRLAGCPVVTYKRGETTIDVNAVKKTTTPESLNFNGFELYNDSIIFEMQKEQLRDIFPPKEGDIIVYENIPYHVQKANSSPCWLDSGVYDIVVKVHARRLR